jgi:hypothetical protein
MITSSFGLCDLTSAPAFTRPDRHALAHRSVLFTPACPRVGAKSDGIVLGNAEDCQPPQGRALNGDRRPAAP